MQSVISNMAQNLDNELICAVERSQRLFLHHNAIFLAHRLYEHFPTLQSIYTLAHAYHLSGDTRTAYRFLDRHHPFSTENSNLFFSAMYLYGIAQVYMNRYSQAEGILLELERTIFSTSIETRPSNWRNLLAGIYHWLAQCAQHLQKHGEAVERYNNCLIQDATQCASFMVGTQTYGEKMNTPATFMNHHDVSHMKIVTRKNESNDTSAIVSVVPEKRLRREQNNFVSAKGGKQQIRIPSPSLEYRHFSLKKAILSFTHSSCAVFTGGEKPSTMLPLYFKKRNLFSLAKDPDERLQKFRRSSSHPLMKTNHNVSNDRLEVSKDDREGFSDQSRTQSTPPRFFSALKTLPNLNQKPTLFVGERGLRRYLQSIMDWYRKICFYHTTEREQDFPIGYSLEGQEAPEWCQFGYAQSLFDQGFYHEASSIWISSYRKRPWLLSSSMISCSTALRYIKKVTVLRRLAQNCVTMEPMHYITLCVSGNYHNLVTTSEKAQEMFSLATMMNPSCSDAYVLYGLEHLRNEKLSVAEQHFHQALKISPRLYTAIIELGNVAHLRGDDKLAQKYFDEAIKINPVHPKILEGLAQSLRHEDSNDEKIRALNLYHRVLTENPENHDVRLQRAETFMSMSQIECALTDLEYLCTFCSENARTYFKLAQCLALLDRTTEAVMSYQYATDLDESLGDMVTDALDQLSSRLTKSTQNF